jgi:hypothetical protein
MGKGKSSLELTVELWEKEYERLEQLADHDDKKVRRIAERAVKAYLALRRVIPDRSGRRSPHWPRGRTWTREPSWALT